MLKFGERASAAIKRLNDRLSALVKAIESTPADARLPRESLDELLKITARARKASDAIARSFTLVDVTALDIVDMQVRLQGETAQLASSLRDLGKAVERQHFIGDAFDAALVAV